MSIPPPESDDSSEARRRRVGAYAKLLANYASDDAIIAAGEPAELLFVRGLAFCATSDADGYITDAQVLRYVGAGMRDAAKRARKLAEVGVWEKVDGGYQVRSWLKIHESSQEKGRRRANDRERKAKQPKDSDDPSARIPDGIPPEDVAESLSLIQSTTETLHDTAPQTDKALGGDRPETLRSVPATNPPKANDDERCTRHPNGNPTDEPCGGCKRVEDRKARRLEREAEKARVVAEEAARNCGLCEGTHFVLDADKNPTRKKCTDHRRSA